MGYTGDRDEWCLSSAAADINQGGCGIAVLAMLSKQVEVLLLLNVARPARTHRCRNDGATVCMHPVAFRVSLFGHAELSAKHRCMACSSEAV